MKKLCTTILMVAFLAVSTTAYGNDEALEFEAKLSGAQEVSPPAPLNGVDTDTTGKIKVEFSDDLSEADFRLKVRDGFAVTQAHLHCGRAGTNGPVVVFLFGFVVGGVDVDGELARGTLTNADITDVGADCVPAIGRPVNNIASLAFAARDGLIYANVHTVANPPGEIRGQLLEDDKDDDKGKRKDRDKDDDDDDDDDD